MAYSAALAARVRSCLARRRGIEEKKMFGGVGFLLHGNLLVGVWRESLIARIGPVEWETARREPFVREFDITGRSMTGWVMIAPEGLDGNDQLDDWIRLSTAFVKTLPRKSGTAK